MRRFILWFVFSLGLFSCLQAQTRKIGHRSHSGSRETFAMLMGEEHLGEGNMFDYPEYNVEPFVLKIRKHYEAIAKQSPAAKADAPAPSKGDSPTSPPDSMRAPQPGPPPSSTVPNSPVRPKSKKNPKEAAPMASEIPSPDFLVKSRPHAEAATQATGTASAKSSLWLLVGLLAFPVAPGVFFASAVMGRKRKEE